MLALLSKLLAVFISAENKDKLRNVIQVEGLHLLSLQIEDLVSVIERGSFH